VWLCRYALLCRIAPSSVVCLSLCQSVTLVSPAKMDETIKLPFAFRTRVGPMNHVLHEVQMPTWEVAILRGNGQTIVQSYKDTPQSYVQRRVIRSRCRFGLWARMGPKHHVTWGIQIRHLKG